MTYYIAVDKGRALFKYGFESARISVACLFISSVFNAALSKFSLITDFLCVFFFTEMVTGINS